MNETYIKMCRRAEEIQELWEPKIGDCVISIDERDEKYGSAFVREDNFQDRIDGKKNCYNEVWISGDLWLPCQENLQEIAQKYLDIHMSMELFEKFMNWLFAFYGEIKYIIDDPDECLINHVYRNGEMSLLSINEVWLCFVMETCFNKQWDSGKDEWVPI